MPRNYTTPADQHRGRRIHEDGAMKDSIIKFALAALILLLAGCKVSVKEQAL
jgi:hypothetical protein